MRRFPLIALLSLAACAPSGTATVPAMAPSSNRFISANGRGANIGSGAEAFAPPQTVAVSFDQAWDAVLDAYAATELPVQVVNRAAGQIASRFSVNGRMMGAPVSTFLRCGGAIGTVEVANDYLVDVQLQILVAPKGGNEAEIHTQLLASAKDRFTSTEPRQCVTRGVLEDRLMAHARDRLGLPPVRPTSPALPAASAVVQPWNERPLEPTVDIPPVGDGRGLGASHPMLLTLGGLAGGAVGTLVGSQLGEDCERHCLNARGLLGPLVGNTVLIPLGTHLSNRGKGSLASSFLSAGGWAALGAVVAGLTDEGWAVWAITPGQVLTSVLIEHSSSTR